MIFRQAAVDPNDARALLELGRQCVAGGAYAAAIPFYSRYLYIAPEDGAVHKEYARMLSWSEPLARSITEYHRLLESNPEDDAARMEMARLMNRAGWHHAAIQELQGLRKRLPDDPGVRVELVRALAWDGDHEGCTALLIALARKPTVLEPQSLQFLADAAARQALPLEERVFLLAAERVGVATPAMQARLESLAARGAEKPGTVAGAMPPDADFSDFWQLVMNHRRSQYSARIRIGDAWMERNPADLTSTWETGEIHESLEQNNRALACYSKVATVNDPPLVWARVRRLQALMAADSGAPTPEMPEPIP